MKLPNYNQRLLSIESRTQRFMLGSVVVMLLVLLMIAVKQDYFHRSVNHSRKQYVVGAVHTQTIEGFWSLVQRGVMGTFHRVSAKYLPLYVAEFQFRYNNRENDDIFGAAISAC